MSKIIDKGESDMDMRKLCDELMKDEDIKDIPLTFVFRVVFSVFKLINSGKCAYKDWENI